MTAPSSCSSTRTFNYRTLAQGPRCGRAASGHQGRRPARHSLPNPADPRVLAGADRLVAVGCFSVGTNQVDLDAARQRGIPVFNAPFSNTRSVAELVIGEIVMLLRRIFPRSVGGSQGRLGQIRDRQPRGARPHARHRRLWQYRIAALDPCRSDGHEGDLLRPHRQASPRQHRAGREPRTICWRRATSSACMFRRRRPRMA